MASMLTSIDPDASKTIINSGASALGRSSGQRFLALTIICSLQWRSSCRVTLPMSAALLLSSGSRVSMPCKVLQLLPAASIRLPSSCTGSGFGGGIGSAG
ncbi:hypothetical protein D3C76_1457270 [compost metagenome]